MEDESVYYAESKFKQFTSAVEKTLKSFEYSSEWADLISCLGKLNKVIQAYSKYPVIPKKLLVGKRLAQCLHPALPSGVHLKTLDTYKLIFKQIGPAMLIQDIFIYSSGLFPLLSQAAISVKPVLLDIYAEYYVPLGKNLTPALPGLIMALLPGIEEASEHTERTTEILEELFKNTNQESFFSAVWGCSLHSPPVRLSAMIFIQNHLSKLSSQVDKKYVIGNNRQLMVNALCSSLEDSNVLVQRITLDFMLTFIPLDSEVVTQSHLVNLLMHSLAVVLRRDMSLNRRLYQWILNINNNGHQTETSRKNGAKSNVVEDHDDVTATSVNYFEQHSKKYVVAAVINLFYSSEPEYKYNAVENELFPRTSRKHDKLKPFRILISLLDKPEIGSSVLEDVLVEVFRVLRHECETEYSKDSLDVKDKKQMRGLRDELIKTANMLFVAFQPYFIWDYLEKLFTKCFLDEQNDDVRNDSRDNHDHYDDRLGDEARAELVTAHAPGCLEILRLTGFLLDIISVEATAETQTEHWPSLLNCFVTEMTQNIEQLTATELHHGILLAMKLLSKVSPSMKSPEPTRRGSESSLKSKPRSSFSCHKSGGSDASRTGSIADHETEAYEQGAWEFHEVCDAATSKRNNVMQNCIESSKSFFARYVTHSLMPWLLGNDAHSSSSESAAFVLDADSSCESPVLAENEATARDSKCEIQIQSFALFCRYLVELSCFPSWMSPVEFANSSSTDESLSDWIQCLVSCARQKKDFCIQSAAIGTLLDLINVNLCVFPSSRGHHLTPGAANVVPLITQEDFAVLEMSPIYKEFAVSLWERIQPDNCHLHFSCTELLLRLHNISPTTLTCEDVVCNSMVNQHLAMRQNAHWKFAILWHLSREFYKNESSKSSRGGNRTLDRCMLLMLDSLGNEDPSIRKSVQEWLKHAIHYGDIGRLLEPLLLIMLSPSSRRISVHYASFWKSGDEAAHGRLKASKIKFGGENTGQDSCSSGSDNDGEHYDEDGNKGCIQSANKQRSESISNESRSESELREIEALKVDSTTENEFADDECDEPRENAKEDQHQINATTQRPVRKTSKSEHQNKRSNLLTKNNHSIDDINLPSSKMNGVEKSSKPVHPLHVHCLFYTQPYDTTQTMYALKAIMSIVESDGRAFVCAAATTSMNMCNTGHQSGLRELLIRHRRALTGKDFYGSLADSQQLLIKASTAKYMEILLSICLYFVRSDYHVNISASSSDTQGNFCVKVASVQLLTRIVYVLLEVVVDSGAGFSSFVLDLFSRCKVQRIALHCLLSHVYTLSNDNREDHVGCHRYDINNQSLDKKAFDIQKNLLQLIKNLIFLEDRIGIDEQPQTGEARSKSRSSNKDRKFKTHDKDKGGIGLKPFEYTIGKPIASQSMFLSVILSAIKEDRWCHVHHEWNALLIATLPKLGASLPKVAVPVVDQLALNLKKITALYCDSAEGKLEYTPNEIPVDHMLTLLEDLTAICHYCLTENEVLSSGVSMAPHQVSSSSKSTRPGESDDASSSIFANLVHVFSSQAIPNKTVATDEADKPMVEAKEGLLSILPAMLSSLVTVWHAWNTHDALKSRWKLATQVPLSIGSNKKVRQSILQLLTPLAMQHTIVFLAAVADVWSLTKHKDTSNRNVNPNCIEKEKEWLTFMNQKVLPPTTPEQLALLDIIMAIKVLSFEKILETTKQILRQTLISKDKPSNPSQSLEVNMLQFLHAFVLKTPHDQLKQIKTPLLSLLRDGLQLGITPPAHFVLLNIFYAFVTRVPAAEERRTRRELQDLAQKFFETCNAISAASLDNSAWFKRTVTVVQQSDQSTDMDDTTQSDKACPPPNAELATTSLPNSIQIRNAQYSAQALCVMAELLSSMMDLLYISEEKDKIASSLFYIMYNLTPYLKDHSPQNTTSFRACSALLCAITDYQYTLRAWKKDVYELFLENDFFKLDLLALTYWKSIIDRLMTYDNATFKDLMSRINLSQSGAINIFANREQEMEQRAQLLKRLTFVIFCGEVDQYHNYVPDIQERLVESLRQKQAPALHQQVFFCFRVLILRMSPHHLTSLWPPIVTELILVFLQMERDICSSASPNGMSQRSTKGSSGGILGTLEAFFGIHGVYQSRHKKWYGLYLEACKLLDLAVALHSDAIPHFQLYRWAFIDTPGVESDDHHRKHLHPGGVMAQNGMNACSSSSTAVNGGDDDDYVHDDNGGGDVRKSSKHDPNAKMVDDKSQTRKSGMKSSSNTDMKADSKASGKSDTKTDSKASGKSDTKAVDIKPDKSGKESMSKLSVMNAPLSSKLRKHDSKRTQKKKSALSDVDQESDSMLKFVPYISKILKMLSQHSAADGDKTKEQSQLVRGRQFLDLRKIRSVQELLPFFMALPSCDVSSNVSDSKVFDLGFTESLVAKDFQQITHSK
eukprot:gene522-1172_t